MFVPLVVAAVVNWLRGRTASVRPRRTPRHVERPRGDEPPLRRAGRAARPSFPSASAGACSIVIGFILTYTLCYNIWSSFAFPFYLDYLHYTKDEVAFASKVFGIFMTMIGISLGGYLFGRDRPLPDGADRRRSCRRSAISFTPILPRAARTSTRFAHRCGSNACSACVRQPTTGWCACCSPICYENISTGIALTAFVAYLSGIVSKKFTAVQYALLSSLTFLVGSLGRGIAGEAFDTYGYALVFRWTAAAGLIAVLFVLLEWVRVAAAGPPRGPRRHGAERRRREAANALVRHLLVRGEDRSGKVERAEDQHARVRRERRRALPRHRRAASAGKPSSPAISTSSLGREAGVVGDRHRMNTLPAMPRERLEASPGGSLVARLAKIRCSGLPSANWRLAKLAICRAAEGLWPPSSQTSRLPDQRPGREPLQPRRPVRPAHRRVQSRSAEREARPGGAASRPPARRSSPGGGRAAAAAADRASPCSSW